MANLNMLLNDKAAEESGVLCPYPRTDIKVKIRRVSYPPFQRALAELKRTIIEKYWVEPEKTDDPLKSLLEKSNQESRIIEEHGDELNRETSRLVGRYLINGWENITERVDRGEGHNPRYESVAIPFSTEAAINLTTHDGAGDFVQWVLGQSEKRAHFRMKQEVSLRGNSSGGSSGTTDTQEQTNKSD